MAPAAWVALASVAASWAWPGMAAGAGVDAAAGAAVFTQNCQLCHQSGAVGLAGAFPRLAGRVAAISTQQKGRAYLIEVLTYGMAGTISVDRQPLVGLMPPFAQLPPEDVAAVLNYVQTLGDPPSTRAAPFSAEEISAVRAQPAKTAGDVHAERQALGKARIIVP